MPRSSPPASEPVLHFYLDWSAGIAKITPYFLAHGTAGCVREGDECLSGCPPTLLDGREVRVKGRQREATSFRRNLDIPEICGLK